MKLTFQIAYRTVWGESLGVVLQGDAARHVMLGTCDGEHWTGETETDAGNERLSYRYAVYRQGTCVRMEGGYMPHSFRPDGAVGDSYLLRDYWRDLPFASYLYSSAFSGDFRPDDKAPLMKEARVTFRALCPALSRTRRQLAVSGNCPALGGWQRAVPMRETAPNEWNLSIEAARLTGATEYKFVWWNAEQGRIEAWEQGDNRRLTCSGDYTATVTEEAEPLFERPALRVAGTAIPVFSLRSEGSFGAGDFGDLTQFIDWASETHQQAIQILPINDTTITHTWTDSYPYNSISIYAFHPMYIDLRQLSPLQDKEAAKRFEKRRKELNALPQVDYEAVNEAKRNYLRLLFEQEGKAVLASASFLRFFDANKPWLRPYAAFSHLRDLYGTPDFSRWPAYSIYNDGEAAALCSPESECYEEIAFYYYLQYNLHVQLLRAADHARERGIIFKGDIPIGISRHSVEAWTEPHCFNLNGQAGAPPDPFSANGQNWGFPTYNWEVMEQDGYQWWQRRFRKMAEYFTAYRIDHILGFFRIWEIPAHSVHGLLGQFVPALPMSAAEIESFGLPFQREFMTRPFINEDILCRLFGDKAESVKSVFLNRLHDDIYAMKPQFDTQRKVEACFAGRTDDDSVKLRDGLYALISDVLFVPDRRDASLYHPRIAVQNDFIFERLNPDEKAAFNRLYNHYFYQRHNRFWYDEAMKKLPILTSATPMLVCGEDLGMVPDCVPWVMEQLQILSLEIQRMPKDPKHEFGHVWEYPYRSVCTISTHDMSTLRGWWEENAEETARFYHHVLGYGGDTPASASGKLCKEVVRRHLQSPSMLCILSFQDWLSMDEALRYPDPAGERINVPANPRHYWRYRMHLTIEELRRQNTFNNKLRELIDSTGRYV